MTARRVMPKSGATPAQARPGRAQAQPGRATTPRVSRRRCLVGLGGAMLAIPTLRSLGRPTKARAQDPLPDGPQRRAIFLYMPQNETEDFLPDTYGREFSLAGKYVEPLAPFADQLLLLHNLKGRSGHHAGHSECLTGFTGEPNRFRPRQGPSIDQLLGDRLRSTTRFGSLELTVMSKQIASRYDGVLSWTKDALPVPAIHEPYAAFTRLFGKPGGTWDGSEAEREEHQHLHRSMLDHLTEDYLGLQARINAEDRQLLDAHLTLLRETELQLLDTPLACDQSGPAPQEPAVQEPEWARGDRQAKTAQYSSIIEAALRCDATRVITWAFGFAQDDDHFLFLDVGASFHDIAHRDLVGEERKPRDLHFAIRHWQAQQVAALAQRLASIDADGPYGSVLDQSVIAWLPELGYCPSTSNVEPHSRDDSAALLLGGAGGILDPGQVIDMGGQDYCNLLLTLVHAMGFDDLNALGARGDHVLSELLRSA